MKDYIKQLETQNEELKQSLANSQAQTVYWDDTLTCFIDKSNNIYRVVSRYMVTSQHVFAYISYHTTPYPYQAVICHRNIAYDAKTLQETKEWIEDRFKELFDIYTDKNLT